jgi:uncharacterized membrane protein
MSGVRIPVNRWRTRANMTLADFARIAPGLTNPITIIGFALFLFFGIHRLLVQSAIIPPVSQLDASLIVRTILRYGFWISVLTIVLGFIYAVITNGLAGFISGAEKLSSRKSNLQLVDTYFEDSTLNVKLQNIGNGAALIYELRLLFYSAVATDISCGGMVATQGCSTLYSESI